jgi:hypothetical protein
LPALNSAGTPSWDTQFTSEWNTGKADDHMPLCHRNCLLVLGLALVSVVLAGGPGRSAPLDEAACTQLKEEHNKLVQSGVKTAMDRGAEWGKANADPAMLKDIARLIEVEEGLSFRCPQPKSVLLKELDDEGEAPAPKAGPKPAVKTKSPDAKGKGQTVQPAKETAVAKPKPKPKPQPQAKPATKVNDAYVPPARDAYVPPPKAPTASAPAPQVK